MTTQAKGMTTQAQSQAETDKQVIRTALKAAIAGGASLPQLIEAHALAEYYRMPHVVADLRKAIRHLIPDPASSVSGLSRTVGVGMITGLFTFYVLRYLTHNNVPK